MLSTKQEALGIQFKGRKHYHERNYTAAITEYNKALELRDVPFTIQVRILDDRAAAWVRIGGTVNLELALLDARVMTQLSKDQADGYLRAGKILQLLDEDKSALDVLEYGIKQVKPGSPQSEV